VKDVGTGEKQNKNKLKLAQARFYRPQGRHYIMPIKLKFVMKQDTAGSL